MHLKLIHMHMWHTSIAAFNENRKKKVSPGTGVCIDESMGKMDTILSGYPRRYS